MKLLLLAGGPWVSDPERGEYPPYLAEIDGKVLLERVIDSFASLDADPIMAVSKRAARLGHVGDIIAVISESSQVVEVSEDTQGAACTALMTIDLVDPEEELVITNATDLVDTDWRSRIAEFRASGASAGTLVFDSLHPRYSFVRVTPDGWVTEVAEKRPFSRNATVGTYWFKRAGDFFDAAAASIRKGAAVSGRYFVAPTFNELLLQQLKVRAIRIEGNEYHPFKSNKQIDSYEAQWEGGR